MGENSDFVRVRMPAPWKADGAVTQAKLDLDRTVCSLAFVWFWTRFPQLGSASLGFQTFWETNPKVQGNPRVWEALRVACEALLAGDVELCNTILEVRGRFPSRPYMVAYFLDDSLCACVTGWGHSSPARHAGNVLRCSRLPVRSPAVLLQQPYQHFESRGSVVTQAQWPCGHGGRHTHYAPNIRLGESRLVCFVNSSRRA
jgi:hypothetical protein